MRITCPECGVRFDDEFRTTICPHGTFAANDGHNNFAHHPESKLVPVDDITQAASEYADQHCPKMLEIPGLNVQAQKGADVGDLGTPCGKHSSRVGRKAMPEIDIAKEDPRKFKQIRRAPMFGLDEQAEAYADRECEGLITGWGVVMPPIEEDCASRIKLEAVTAISKLILMNAFLAGTRALGSNNNPMIAYPVPPKTPKNPKRKKDPR